MKQIKLGIALIILFIITGCGGNKLIEYSDSTDCTTTIEGNFVSKQYYKNNAPAVLFPEASKETIFYGKVIKKDTNGVYVLRKKVGWFDTPDTSYFKYDEIRAIVDSNKRCVWGRLEDDEKTGIKLTIQLKKVNDPNYSPIYLELTPGKNFQYCILPGSYEITNIKKENPDEDTYYLSMPDSVGEFVIKPESANYIGDITLLSDNSTDYATITIPYKAQSTGREAASMGGFLGGAIGGAIAGAITEHSNEEADTAGSFFINIKYNPDYKSKSKSHVVETIITPFK